jgi:hypothetical protein
MVRYGELNELDLRLGGMRGSRVPGASVDMGPVIRMAVVAWLNRCGVRVGTGGVRLCGLV